MNGRFPSPLVGFNNNVRYRGMSFHIQTEDSGLGRPHIVTHLFADGGRVIKTLRVDYSQHVDHPDYRTTVQRMMRDQHKAMAYDLRKGNVDAIIDQLMLRPARDGKRSLRPEQAADGSERNDAAPSPADPKPVQAVAERPAPTRSGVFSAVPSVSLDEMILGYVARSRR